MTEKNKILIVDDQPYLLEALFDVLEQEGYRVTACKTAFEAEHLIKTMDFEVAVLDLKIAESDGLALAVTLKEYNPNLAVLFLTAYPSQETAVKSLKIGAVDYLIKPVNVDELINAIKNAFSYREKNQDLESLKSNLISVKQELKQTKDALLKANKSSSLGQVSMEIFHELKNMLAVMMFSLSF